ncbi:hypothetical protein H7H51_25035 [Mycolicibacterium farcinogenes]|nr:hypothetical protein [Mycolicibacterium farcinogenes]
MADVPRRPHVEQRSIVALADVATGMAALQSANGCRSAQTTLDAANQAVRSGNWKLARRSLKRQLDSEASMCAAITSDLITAMRAAERRVPQSGHARERLDCKARQGNRSHS